MSLAVFTALVGMVLAPGALPVDRGLLAITSIALGAGAAGALNMWWDAPIDARMARTARRPIPSGRLTGAEALAFGVALAVFSVALLALATSILAAALLAGTILFYSVVYTIWLKHRTAQNIVIGGAAGALPPVIGWVAASGSLDWQAWLLFLIIALWTPPHFWALALTRSADYAAAKVPMLPVVAGEAATRRAIFGYTLVLLPVSLAPWPAAIAGPVYTFVAIWVGAGLLRRAITLWRAPAAEVRARARALFRYSILYLAALFAALLLDALLPLPV